MIKNFPVRYGSNLKVVFAIILPCLLIIPFIFLMQPYKNLKEWQMMMIIFIFLAFIISLTLWLVTRIYPRATLEIEKENFNLSFDRTNPLAPNNFSFTISDIASLTRREIGGDEYFIFKLEHPTRRFQISASSSDWEKRLVFEEAIEEIAGMLQASQKTSL